MARVRWHVQEIDGHDMTAILAALDMAETVKGQPSFIVAHTIKGKGISFTEANPRWHMGTFTEDEYIQAIAELEDAAR